MGIHSNLSALMGKFRYTMQEVHELTGLSRTTISTLYNDKVRRIDYDTIEKLCRLFGCGVGDLIVFAPAKKREPAGGAPAAGYRDRFHEALLRQTSGEEPPAGAEPNFYVKGSVSMRPVKIVTDSCSDLDGALLDSHRIVYAHMNTVRHGKETPASLTWEHFSPKEFYDLMRNEASPEDRITTTQVPPEECVRIFNEACEKGEDVVYIACSSKQTGSVNTARVVAKQMMEEHPEMTIVCIDSLNASAGEGILALRASTLRDAGLSAQEIGEKITACRKNVVQYVAVNTLDYLKRAGRVKASAAFFGNLMGVKPILVSDVNGVQTPIKKVKGRGNSIAEMVRLMKDNIVDAENQTIYLAHADCDEKEVESFRAKLLDETGCRDVYVLPIGPIIGASVGPDTLAIFAFGKEVTFEG